MIKKSNFLELEEKYKQKWDEEKTYAYQDSSSKQTFVIDTPPPTVSGSLHIGHVFSYTQTDILARFHRMQGKNVFYPMGWDDNGLPTEKRVQKLYAVRCDPKQPYDPSFKAQKHQEKISSYQALSPKNFSSLCHQQVVEDEAQYKKLIRRIALSVDWSHTYKTIGPYVQTLAQISFLDLYAKKLVDHRFSPVLWDTQFQTAVAGADIEDREMQGAYHDIAFSGETGEITISTTRPELLPACIAIAAHPEDERYKKFFGKTAITPLFYREVPILLSSHADPEKGTGALMICTFGDREDVAFWEKQFAKKQNEGDILQIINEEGLLKDVEFGKKPFLSTKPEEANSNYSHLKGLKVKQARKKITELLKAHKYLKSEPKLCLQHVKFYEKGDFPLEILPKRQWYIKLLDHKDPLLKMGRKVDWHPPAMRKRYEQWVQGLNQDWCISRQRFYGVPFPVWYKVNEKGLTDYNQVIVPLAQDLFFNKTLPYDPQTEPFSYPAEELTSPAGKQEFPINPLKQAPKGFTEEQRDQPGGFTAESHVMDTWATSSLTPYINSGWLLNSERHKKLFPADLRPQAHEIIRTWAFYSLVKAYFHENKVPWKNIAISGWLITPERKKNEQIQRQNFIS